MAVELIDLKIDYGQESVHTITDLETLSRIMNRIVQTKFEAFLCASATNLA